eukprot:MONOS_14579.1-p1 / transcript=MONOS_14579.1 / gene=MONOS_14579 / organism=Monocercomonoides_exilis_PA203 / gene_product=unspecified product / transcript_product=unspecified product / location=Mono_scaffold01027:16654-17620(-) / protein_length=300 / sequence_SO=supercontig / SO=protein_coding / is_pseudo=false
MCVPYLLKVALNKEKNKEAQKEVEMALLTLSNFGEYLSFNFFENERIQKLYVDEIKDIILYHQDHQNLTRLAYQSVLECLLDRFEEDESLEEVVVNEVHLGREAAKEVEELWKCMDWKKKEEERGKGREEEMILMRWLKTLNIYFCNCRLRNEECIELIRCIVRLFRAAKDNCEGIRYWCDYLFETTAGKKAVEIKNLLKGRAVELFLEEIQQTKLDNIMTLHGLVYFMNVSNRLKEEMGDIIEKAKRKAAKKLIFEKMEEEGYEDVMISFHKMLSFLKDQHCGFGYISLNISDYFVNV